VFDIGSIEILIIGIVALVVIGPERLPKIARTAGHWLGRVRRFVGNVRNDIEREIRQEQIREALGRDADLDEIKTIINDTKFTIEDEVNNVKQEYVVAARDDDPGRDSVEHDSSNGDHSMSSQQQQIQQQEDDFNDDQLTDHADNSDELDRKFEAEKAEASKAITDNDPQNEKSNG